jgi:hypothetical protein
MWHRSLAGAGVVSLALSAHGQVVYREIALSGQPAPGTGAGVTFFNSFEQQFITLPRITPDGRVTFFATLSGAQQGVDDQGIWTQGPGGPLRLVARRGQTAPGTPEGTTFIGFPLFPPTLPVLTGVQVSAFLAGLAGPGVTPGQTSGASGIFFDSGGTLRLLVRHGDPAPGLTGLSFDRSDHASPLRVPLVSTLDHTLVGSFLAGPGVDATNDESLWTNRSGSLQLLLREGDPAPGTNAVFGAAPDSFSPGGLRAYSFSNASRLALFGNLRGPGIDFQNDDGIWAEGPAGLTLIAREGDPAPGFPGAVFAGGAGDVFGAPATNAAGAVVFFARLSGAPVTSGIFSTRSGVLASEGTSFIGQQSGERVIPGRANIGQSGALALEGGLIAAGQTSSTDTGIWSDHAGPMRLVARTGMQAPDSAPGVVFDSLEPTGRFFLKVTAQGVGFVASLRGPGVDSSNDLGFYLHDASGTNHRILRRGDTLHIGGQVRTVADLLVGQMNESAETVLKAGFTDGAFAVLTAQLGSCYPNCDASSTPPVLNVTDFTCFLQKYAAGDAYANCDGSTAAPVLNVIDFTCFLQKYAGGCVR